MDEDTNLKVAKVNKTTSWVKIISMKQMLTLYQLTCGGLVKWLNVLLSDHRRRFFSSSNLSELLDIKP
jgi:hypothetical protein